MPDKLQIIEHFKSLDVTTLSRLYQFSKLVKMLYPEEDLLVNANMAQMVDKSLSLREVHIPEWDDSSDSDFGTFITELIALFSEKDFWYINSFFNEAFLGRARMYRSAYLRSLELGYYPILRRAASADFDVVFAGSEAIPNPPSEHVYLPGALLVKERTSDLHYTNFDTFSVPFSTSQTTRVVELIQAKPYLESTNFNGDHVFISRTNLSFYHIIVEVEGVPWRRMTQFGESDSFDKHFVVFPEDDGAVSIYFGDGEFGAKPSLGDSVEVTVFETSGSIANRPHTPFVVISSDIQRPAIAVINSPLPSGGSDQETMSSIVNKAPLETISRKGIINVSDVENYLSAQNDVTKSRVFFSGSSVTFMAIGNDGEEIVSSRRTQLASEIEERSVLLGYIFTGIPVNFFDLPFMNVEILISRMGSITFTRERAYILIQDFFNPATFGNFGRPFEQNMLRAHLQSNLAHLVRIDIFEGASPSSVPYPQTVNVRRNEIIRKPVIDQLNNPTVTVTVNFV